MLIALDANIWIKERLLRSATGVAFLHTLRRMNAKLLLPAVTRDEIIAGAGRAGLEAVRKVEGELITVQSLMGSRPNCGLPSEGSFRHAAQERIAELTDLLLAVAVTSEHHERALVRVHEHLPPAATREQYRDCLLWEALMSEHDGESFLVSADKDFVDKGSTATGLAQSLREDSNGEVILYRSLSDCLVALEPRIAPVELEPVVAAIADAVLPILEQHAQERGFDLGQMSNADVDLFATEQVDTTAAVFKLTFSAYEFPLPDLSVLDEVELVASGNCILSTDNQVENFSMDEVRPQSLRGEYLPGAILYASTKVSGRHTPYRVQTPIRGGTA